MDTYEKWICLDTETTGFGPKTNKIIEIAAVEFDPKTGRASGSYYHTYLNPGMPVNFHAAKVHGMTWEKLKNYPDFDSVAHEFRVFIQGANLVMHNARFDVSFINAEFDRLHLSSIDQVAMGVIDTLGLSKRHLKSLEKHTLDVLCDHFGVDRTKRTMHGALIDCEMLAQVFPHLAALAPDMKQKVEAVKSRPISQMTQSNLSKPLSIMVQKPISQENRPRPVRLQFRSLVSAHYGK